MYIFISFDLASVSSKGGQSDQEMPLLEHLSGLLTKGDILQGVEQLHLSATLAASRVKKL
jgi:hypothetical protein